MKIRPAERKDRDRIHEILVSTARFTADEVRSAIDLVDQGLDRPERGEYVLYVLEEPDSGPKKMVQGYVCFGATPLAERAYHELRATGASPRKLIRTGAGTLTASERRVAQMAVSGMSNKQIAQALFVTVKTVESHLAQSYRKLGVSSRTELGSVLSQDRAGA